MKLIIGLLLMVAGVVLSAYVGIWLMPVGGIIQVINGIKHDWQAMSVALGIARIMFSTAAAALSAWLLILPGFGFIVAWVHDHDL